MPRIALIFRTDTHVSDRSPVSWKADYQEEIWSSLTQIGQIARSHEARVVLDGGDYFHVKAASRNSHALVSRTAEIHHDYPCPVYCAEGNHDIAYNNLASIDKQPLGVLFASKVFHPMREVVLEDAGLRVRVVGVPYSPFRTMAELHAIRKQPGDDFLIVVVHALAGAAPPASVEDFFGEPVFRYGDLIQKDGPDAFCFGHWHKDQGVLTHEGVTFVNQGAVSRGALATENLERTPQVSLIEIDKGGLRVRPIKLDVAPAEDVFDLERKERQETEARNIERFVQQLRADSQFDPSRSIEANLEEFSVAREVRDLTLMYLNRARSEVG